MTITVKGSRDKICILPSFVVIISVLSFSVPEVRTQRGTISCSMSYTTSDGDCSSSINTCTADTRTIGLGTLQISALIATDKSTHMLLLSWAHVIL